MGVQSYDCLIVGGGPAGSTCAWKLRQAGVHVLVLDKAAFPRDKTCAGWITPPVVKSLELDVVDYARSYTWQPIRGFRCGLIDGGSVDVDYAAPVSLGIRRREFDAYLLRRAGAATAQQHVSSIVRSGETWLIDNTYSAPMLVGAGGSFCPVARYLGRPRASPETMVFAQEVEFPVTESELERLAVAADRPELYFCKDLRGYGWCFRKREFLNIGLGRTDQHDLSQQVDGFCNFLLHAARVRCNLPTRFHGHAYRLYGGHQHGFPSADGALLIGDSAGLAYPQSGEGIGPAVGSGLLAAEIIIQSAGRYSRDRLAGYPQLLQRRLNPVHTNGLLHLLPASWLAAATATLLTHSWFAKRFVMDKFFLRSGCNKSFLAVARQPAQ